MKTEVKTGSQLCRCCHSEGEFKSLDSSISAKNETFALMLLYVLDVQLMPIKEETESSAWAICVDCVNKLIDAHNFKQQVLTCEEEFENLYGSKVITFEQELVNDTVEQALAENDKIERTVVAKEKIEQTLAENFTIEHTLAEKDSVEQKLTSKHEIIIPPSDRKLRHLKPLTYYEKKTPAVVKTNSKETIDSGVIKIKDDEKRINDEVDIGEENNKRETVNDDLINGGGDDDENGDYFETTEDVEIDTTVEVKKRVRKNDKPEHQWYRLNPNDYTYTDGVYKCKQCGKAFKSRNNLQPHIKTQHSTWTWHKCEQCKEIFKTMNRYVRHKLEEHGIDDRVQCNACEHKFATEHQLKKHFKSYHKLGVCHKCPFCDFECYSSEALYKHKFKHKNTKDYHCRFCKKAFLRKSTLDYHEKIHTGDRRKVCKECGQKFVQKASLNYHMAKYHPSIPF